MTFASSFSFLTHLISHFNSIIIILSSSSTICVRHHKALPCYSASFLRTIFFRVSLDRGPIIDLIVSQCFRTAQSNHFLIHSPFYMCTCTTVRRIPHISRRICYSPPPSPGFFSLDSSSSYSTPTSWHNIILIKSSSIPNLKPFLL